MTGIDMKESGINDHTRRYLFADTVGYFHAQNALIEVAGFLFGQGGEEDVSQAPVTCHEP
ncbi:hypothetical protein D3C86_2060900 [compost metagenome]